MIPNQTVFVDVKTRTSTKMQTSSKDNERGVSVWTPMSIVPERDTASSVPYAREGRRDEKMHQKTPDRSDSRDQR